MKMYRVIFWVVLIGAVLTTGQGCGESAVKGPVGVGLDMDAVLEQRGGVVVAEACTLVDIADIAEALDLEPNEIEVTDSSYPGKNRKASSCFFKWNDFDLPNSGILLQTQRNTFVDDYPDYFVGVIESKKTSGENGLSPETIFFDDFPDIGDDGAYSYKAGSCVWRLGNKVMLTISFNTTFSEERQYRVARKIAAKMTENYIAGR